MEVVRPLVLYALCIMPTVASPRALRQERDKVSASSYEFGIFGHDRDMVDQIPVYDDQLFGEILNAMGTSTGHGSQNSREQAHKSSRSRDDTTLLLETASASSRSGVHKRHRRVRHHGRRHGHGGYHGNRSFQRASATSIMQNTSLAEVSSTKSEHHGESESESQRQSQNEQVEDEGVTPIRTMFDNGGDVTKDGDAEGTWKNFENELPIKPSMMKSFILNVPETQLQSLTSVFIPFDTDQDNQLSAEELAMALETLREPNEPAPKFEDVEDFVKGADHNHDGKISIREILLDMVPESDNEETPRFLKRRHGKRRKGFFKGLVSLLGAALAGLLGMTPGAEDCVCCRMVWSEVEYNVGASKYVEDVADAFEMACYEAAKTRIFSVGCEDMHDDLYPMLDDYMSDTYYIWDMCERAGMCKLFSFLG